MWYTFRRMLPDVGIVMTVGTVDIRRCHFIKEVLDEFAIKGDKLAILNNDFEEEDIDRKVNLYYSEYR